MCWSSTIFELSACKRKGYLSTIQRYFDSLSQKASRLLFITTIIVNPWILDAGWRASIKGCENIGSQAIMLEQLIFGIHKMEVETPFSCIGLSTSDEKWGIINEWIYQIDMLLPKTCRRLCRRQTHSLTNEQQTVCWQPKKLAARKADANHSFAFTSPS